MLSYQHAYHAGNLADVHKHGLLVWVLDYLIRKEKPLSYIETHAGRGIYDLSSAEAQKTGEAAAGISQAAQTFPPEHPYLRVIAATQARFGKSAYPGSPLIAAEILRNFDQIHLAELHPQECQVLKQTFPASRAKVHPTDGLDLVFQLCPPTPRRGIALIDPSYEVKADYLKIAALLPKLARRWNVGTLMLWYPILTDARHNVMTRSLTAKFPTALLHEVQFPPARPGQRLVGSGMFVVNPPYQLDEEAERIAQRIASLSPAP